MDKTRYLQLFLAAQIEASSKNSDEAKTMITGEAFDTTIPVSEDGRISVKEDYRFMLYRHWNLCPCCTSSPRTWHCGLHRKNLNVSKRSVSH